MLDLFQEGVSNTLRTMSTGLKLPVTLLLVLLAALTLFLLGTLIVEIFMEHRHLKVHMPQLVDQIRAAGKGNVAEIIRGSDLLLRQKEALIELTKHPDLTPLMRESLAIRLIAQEKDFYDRRTQRTDLIAKIGPMLGLMGTLIPLGPGIIALGQGDTYTLSTSLLMAFDTTVAGLACAAVALVISTVRKRWYRNYMSMLETLMECTLEMENEQMPQAPAAGAKAGQPSDPASRTEAVAAPQTAASGHPAAAADPQQDQRRQYAAKAYRAAYTEAVQAGYDEAGAKEYARAKASEALTAFANQKAGKYL